MDNTTAPKLPRGWRKWDRNRFALWILTNVAPVHLDGFVSALPMADQYELVKTLANVTAKAAEYGAYVGARYGAGCVDQGHAAAVKAFNKAGKAVWCAVFGYSQYPGVRF